MHILITGADGFIGRNLRLRIAEQAGWTVTPWTRHSVPESLRSAVDQADVVIHLAGVNRPKDVSEFQIGNVDFTVSLCEALAQAAAASNHRPRLILTSSTQADRGNPYGESKKAAEAAMRSLAQAHGHALHVFRLPNVFGKWCRPHYNSAVATFCHQIARDLPIEVHDPSAVLQLIHVDDVIDRFLALVDGAAPLPDALGFETAGPVYSSTVGGVADTIRAFRRSRDTGVIGTVGHGLGRALYATYVSYLPVEVFDYPLVRHEDPRGVFVEMLMTQDSGQFSYFTAHPGVTRGGHYHHAKTEKFLVIQGKACFRFRHMLTGQAHEIHTTAESPRVVETVPGWTHDITNTGDGLMVVMLWANEIFDRTRPDTISAAL
ncbi:UDP-2-acetamido-2,6-beta-L-arabino-hexul-4-ose reductase [Hydrogenophaga sp.]|uniref:UDP-2-acetamido-2,6-beta-L-arabino-hexul-4-ose reductase n=1 Tax=Hydrogenophaga sp. TaxID=1904254 RepID=UPI003F721CB4